MSERRCFRDARFFCFLLACLGDPKAWGDAEFDLDTIAVLKFDGI
jgi:hypothetical protein